MSGPKSRKSTLKGKNNPFKQKPSNEILKEEHRALEYFVQRLQDYLIVFSTDGHYYDVVDGLRHPRNKIVCMLKNDYLSNDIGLLKGKDLERAIERFMTSAEEVFLQQMAKPENAHIVTEQEQFMQDVRDGNGPKIFDKIK